MATPTYELIQTTTLTSSASSVSFTSITQDYRDLVVSIDLPSGGSGDIGIIFNNDNSNKSDVFMFGNGSSTSSSTTSNIVVAFGAAGNSLVNIMDYSATDKHKSVLVRFNHTTIGTQARAGRWASTAAITSVRFGAGSIPSGSTFSLYGIAS